MKENWKPIAGFEERYEVSDHGRVRSVSFKQRYLLRNGIEAYRQKPSKIMAQQQNNSGYMLVHFWMDGHHSAKTVHSLVAKAFLSKTNQEVNHIDGDKTHNHVRNLEWVSRTDNKLHAIKIGLNKTAVRVRDPATGIIYGSIAQAARGARKSHRVISATFQRVAL